MLDGDDVMALSFADKITPTQPSSNGLSFADKIMPIQNSVPTAQIQPQQSTSDSIWSAISNFGSSIAKGTVDTLGTNLSNIGFAANALKDVPAAIGGNQQARNRLATAGQTAEVLPKTTLKQDIGAGLQLGATVATPGAGSATIPAAIGSGALLGASQSGGNSLASGDTLVEAGTKAAIGGAVGGIASGAIAGVGNLLGKMGEKIQTSVIKPTATDIADGFSVENVNKYGLGGTLNQTYSKTQDKLSELTNQLNEKLTNADTSVDIQGVYQQTLADLTSQKGSLKSFGFNTKLASALDQLKAEVDNIIPEASSANAPIDLRNLRNGAIDLASKNFQNDVPTSVSVPEAQLIKQASGKLGAWSFGKTDPESSAVETVYNTFYRNMKIAIEKASPDGVREINKQIGDLIPIQNALIRRMPVAERNAALSLTDIISMTAGTIHPSSFGLSVLNRFMKSGAAGNALSNYVSSAVRKVAPSIGEAIGATSQPPSLATGQ